MEKDIQVTCKYGIRFPKEEPKEEEPIQIAKKPVLTFIGYVSCDEDLPKYPKHGHLYMASADWFSKIINKQINYNDSLVYSSKDNGWVIIEYTGE